MNCCGEIVYKGLCKRGRPVEVMDCAACGFKHLHPKPDAQAMADYYMKEYFATEKPGYAANSGTESEYQQLVDAEKIDVVSESPFVRAVSPSVLDFGCGPSAPFLKHYRLHTHDSGAVLFGYEPSQSDAERRINLEERVMVIVNSLEYVRYRYDIVHLGFVLEHSVNPFETLLEAKMLMVPGGRMIVEVPNDFNPLQMHLWRKLGGVPWWVSSPDHLNHFSAMTLSVLLGRVGLEVVKLGTTYPVELFLAHGADFRTDPAAQKQVVALRADLQRLWKSWPGFKNEIGRTVWVVAKEM